MRKLPWSPTGARLVWLSTLFAFGGAGLLPNVLSAAQIHTEQIDRLTSAVNIEGPIIHGDAAAVRSALDRLPNNVIPLIVLSGPGGAYLEGIALARLFREKKITTLVRKDAGCYSACAVAFLGGSSGGTFTYLSMEIEPGARIGFHAPYLSVPEGAYGKDQIEAAYEQAVRGINEFIKLMNELDLDAGLTPDLLVPFKDRVHEMTFAFDLNDLGIQLRAREFSLPIVTPTMVKNACLNHDPASRYGLRFERSNSPTPSALPIDIDKTKIQVFHEPSSSYYVAVMPNRWRQGGHQWCFIKIFFDRAGLPDIYCAGFKWVKQADTANAMLRRYASAIATGSADDFTADEKCLGIGQTSETRPQHLVPPFTPIVNILPLLREYARREAPLVRPGATPPRP